MARRTRVEVHITCRERLSSQALFSPDVITWRSPPPISLQTPRPRRRSDSIIDLTVRAASDHPEFQEVVLNESNALWWLVAAKAAWTGLRDFFGLCESQPIPRRNQREIAGSMQAAMGDAIIKLDSRTWMFHEIAPQRENLSHLRRKAKRFRR